MYAFLLVPRSFCKWSGGLVWSLPRTKQLSSWWWPRLQGMLISSIFVSFSFFFFCLGGGFLTMALWFMWLVCSEETQLGMICFCAQEEFRRALLMNGGKPNLFVDRVCSSCPWSSLFTWISNNGKVSGACKIKPSNPHIHFVWKFRR